MEIQIYFRNFSLNDCSIFYNLYRINARSLQFASPISNINHSNINNLLLFYLISIKWVKVTFKVIIEMYLLNVVLQEVVQQRTTENI